MKESQSNFIETAYVGIDVHKRSWKVCLLGNFGFMKQFSCKPDVPTLVKSLQKLLPNFYFQCAYEAGFSGFCLHHDLNQIDGFNCIVVNPADIPTSDKERTQKRIKEMLEKLLNNSKPMELKVFTSLKNQTKH